MTFDAREEVRNKTVHLDDEIRDLKARRASATNELDTQINAKQDELDGWNRLLNDGAATPPPAPEPPAQAQKGVTTSDSDAGQALESQEKPAAKKAASAKK